MNAANLTEQRRILEKGRSQPFETEIRLYVAGCIWPGTPTGVEYFDVFFDFLLSRTTAITWCFLTQDLIDNIFAVTTFSELKVVLATLRSAASLKKRDLVTILEQRFPNKQRNQCTHIVEFAAGIWTTLPIDISCHEVHLHDNDIIAWAEDKSLESVVQDYIPRSGTSGENIQLAENHLIDQDLTAERLNRVCRIGLAWTNNLAAHLVYDERNDRILMYPHQPFLVAHLQKLDGDPPLGFAVHRDLLLETIRTLDLLLPPTATTRRFLNSKGLKYPYDQSPVRGRDAVDLTEFVYWRSRLTRLQVLLNRPPTTLTAMWYDRRKPLQWMTFWLAGVFTLVTIVFGLLSSYTAFKQIEIAQKAYDLALTQACMSSAVPQSFCESKMHP